MDIRIAYCPLCRGVGDRPVICEINGVVDETLTRPCATCWGDGMVWIVDGNVVPWRRMRRERVWCG